MFNRLVRFATPVAMLICLASLSAQVERATIAGTIRDASGAVVPKASVTVTNTATKIVLSTTTTESGEYVALNLIPGDYTVSVTAPGFATAVQSGISLHINRRVTVDIDLQVGETTQQVEVTAPAPLIQRESAAITMSSRPSRSRSLN